MFYKAQIQQFISYFFLMIDLVFIFVKLLFLYRVLVLTLFCGLFVLVSCMNYVRQELACN